MCHFHIMWLHVSSPVDIFVLQIIKLFQIKQRLTK